MLAQNMAVCLQARGRDVLLIDGDPQKTSAKWAIGRAKTAAKPIPHVELSGDLYTPVEDLRRRYQDIVIDVAGADSAELESALLAADALYSPMIPSLSDMETAEDIAKVVSLSRVRGNRELRAAIVLNQCDPRDPTEVDDARAELRQRAPSLPVADAVLYIRRPYRRAHRARLGVVEFASHPDAYVRSAAAKAIWEVWRFYSEMTDRENGIFDTSDIIGMDGINGTNGIP